jgi:putative methylase
MIKKELEIKLSKLKDYSNKHPHLEQYTTPANNASDLLWTAYMKGDIEGKVVLDAGCGNGMLGIGALILGAKKVIFVDIDKNAVETAKENIESLGFKNYEIFNNDILDFDKTAEIVVSNPPFGVQKSNNDTYFIKKISQLAKEKIYLIYKGDGLKILQRELPDKNIEVIKSGELMIKSQFSFHKKDKKITKIILAIINI